MSLNVCTDQLVLALADPHQIVSLSYLADNPDLSYLHDRARPFAKNHGLAEEVVTSHPDVIVTSTYSRPTESNLLKQLGIRLEKFDYTQSLASIPHDIRRMGAILGREGRAASMAADLDRDLKRLMTPPKPGAPGVVAFGQNGIVLGKHTLADSIIRAAGFRNLAAEHGYVGMAPYPLELLIEDQPDLLLLSKPYDHAPALADEVESHPAIAALRSTEKYVLPAASWSCGGPFTLKVLRLLKRLALQIEHRHRRDKR